MSTLAARFAVLFAVLGLAASVAAAYTHYHLLFDPSYRSFCDVSATVSCTQVYLSRFSTVGGIPVAIFGAIWSGVVLLLGIAALRARESVRESIPGYIFVLSTAGLAVVLYLGYASFFLLKAVCLLCLTTYVVVLALFFLSSTATSFPLRTLPGRAVRDLRLLARSPLALALTVIVLAGGGVALALFPHEAAVSADTATSSTPSNDDRRSELERFMATAPRMPITVDAGGAKVVIVKFNDYECPACGQSYLQYKPILAKYEASHPGAVRMILKDYPLNPNCNPTMTVMVHPAACDAAVAVRLAQGHNRGPELEEWLYTHQTTMTPQSVRQAAHEVGQVDDFEAKYPATVEQVKTDVALGARLGIRSTPTFFIDGIRVEGAWAPQYFDQAIAYELQRAN